ncbi:MAG: sugar transferase [Bacteroidetes bacterium]|nr:sugar transferase [Bacteroidota bacterium]
MPSESAIFDREVFTLEYNEQLEEAVISRSNSFIVLKRGVDILVSSVIVVSILSWLLPILAIIIKLDSKGPVFFRQKRTGYKGKTFDCFKLRSMSVNRVANDLQAAIDDPRITRVGKFLRKSNLDELPQFINVLIGDMSIVGPRPHMLKDSENFSDIFPGYYNRYLIKPGITGLAQINGFRGPTPNVRSIYKRLQWDLYYVENATIVMDIRIILLTALETVREALKVGLTKKIYHSKLVASRTNKNEIKKAA